MSGGGDIYLDVTLESETGVLNENAISDEKVDVHENLMDVAGAAPEEVDAVDSKSTDVGLQNVLHLNEFFERPIELTTFDVPVGDDVNYTVEIWDAVTSHPSIRAKLRNYAYLQCDIEVRVAISATPFHYSHVLVSYQPFAADNVNLNFLDAELSGTRRDSALVYLSQSPHSGVMDIRENEPLDLTCPYINVQPVIRLFNQSPLIISAGTSYEDTANLGKLYIQSINPVRAASATPSDISIFVYTRMTNVKLGCVTGTVLDITTESHTEVLDITLESETEVGPIERITSKAAAALSWLSTIPSISPLASAGSMAMSGISQVSAIFGWSYPTMTNEPDRVKSMPYQNGAQTVGYDMGKRITLDPMQALTVDPRALACDTDDMMISALCQRKSLLSKFEWTGDDAPLGVPLWVAPVNPNIMHREPTVDGFHWLWSPTGLATAATPFEFWRGDITFHFEVVCSQYHRGKLAFMFEPNISQNIVIDTSLDLNKQFVKVIDLQETQSGSYTVKWAFPKAWARVMPWQLIGYVGDVGHVGDAMFDYANGYIAVVPFTSLQSPDGSDISVNVWIESDNMMFNYMSEKHITSMERPIIVGAEEEKALDVTLESATAIAGSSKEDLNESTANMDGIADLHFGEIPLSFRALCRRFMSPVLEEKSNDPAGMWVRVPNYPPAYEPYTPLPTGTTFSNLLGYLRYSYLGIRGGMKHRLMVSGNIDVGPNSAAFITLDTPTDSRASYATVPFIFAPSLMQMSGTVVEVPFTQGAIEWETPMYTNNLFGLSFSDDMFPATNTNFDPVMLDSSYVSMSWNSDPNDKIVTHSVAIAEDFSLMKFMGGAIYQTNLL